VLLNHLPAESAYQTSLRNSLTPQELKDLAAGHDPSAEAWSRLEHLAAGLDERIQQVLIAMIGSLGGDPPKFQPIYRPGVPRPEGPRELTAEERAVQRAQLEARWDGTKKPPPPSGG
jgi:hypothetical protein